MKSGFKVTYDGLDKLKKINSQIAHTQVLVGIPAAENTRAGDPIGNAAIYRLNEFGSPLQNIPARPSLVPGVRRARKEIVAVLKVGLQDLHNGGSGAIDAALTKAGILAVTSVKNIIRTSEGFQELADSTLAARRREGFNGERPLIRSGQLLGAITYVKRRK